MKNPAVYINADSGNQNYYTPPAIIEAVRSTMGCIDLDPATSYKANETVKAKFIFTLPLDGLSQPWFGTLWLNHPFGRDTNKPWIDKLMSEFYACHVTQACCITYACTSEAWFQPLLRFPQCYLSPRTNYIGPDGETVRGVTKGSVVTYLGNRWHTFAKEFDGLGVVMLPYKWLYV